MKLAEIKTCYCSMNCFNYSKHVSNIFV
uniref:Uncharacterized protein n=1 Tax=Rhizophora mucronata TaxID=61149 RepID=A0A2P2PVV3_RHIMU